MNCLWCGKEMINCRIDKKFCSRSCSAKASRHRQEHNISARNKICNKCGKEFEVIGLQWSRTFCYECVPKSCKTSSQRRKLYKKWCIEYKGGKCERCGYNKCSAALDFYHKNPKKKDFIISDNRDVHSWEELKKEMDKCELLCANCHREEHNKERGDE